jgi:hypothetical protein
LSTIATSSPQGEGERDGQGGEGDVPDQRAEEVPADQRVGEHGGEVAQADVDPPALGQVLALGVDEQAVVVVGGPGLARPGVLDAVAGLVVGPLGGALEGAGEPGGHDRPGGGGHVEVGQVLLAGPGLPDAEDGVAGGLGDVALGRELEAAGGQRLQAVGGAELGGPGLGVDQKEHEVAGDRVALGGDRQPVVGRAGDLGHRGPLDGLDRVLLAALVSVPEVREGGAHGVEHREDLEGQQEQGPGDQVLGRDAAGREVDPEQHRRDQDEQAQPEPLALLDQGEGGEDGDGQDEGQHGDLDDHAGGGGRPGPGLPAGWPAGARGGAGLDRDLCALRHVGLPWLLDLGLDRLGRGGHR